MSDPDHPHHDPPTPRHPDEEDGPVVWMRRDLDRLLFGGDGGPERLTLWLQGRGLPGVGYEEEPYVWLLRALPPADERYRWEAALAREVAALLDAEPDVEAIGEARDRLLYNLLMLAAGLSAADELSEPLWRMYQRRRLRGEWAGADLSDALAGALATNQLDTRLRDVWRAMVRGHSGGFLAGDGYLGFEGLALMPSPEEGRGSPAVADIGWAVGRLAEVLEGEEDRRVELRGLIDHVMEFYPGSGDRRRLERGLLEAARRDRWPDWAVQCLPRLYLPVETADHEAAAANGDRDHFYVWRFYAQLLEPLAQLFPYEVVFEKGEIRRLQVSEKTREFLDEVLPSLERSRLQHQSSSNHSLESELWNETSTLEQALSVQNPLFASALRSTRAKHLQPHTLIQDECVPALAGVGR